VSGKVFQESLSGALAGVGDDAGHHEIGS
jgi:hypothetical protein